MSDRDDEIGESTCINNGLLAMGFRSSGLSRGGLAFGAIVDYSIYTLHI